MSPQTPVLLLCALNLALTVALPRLFFRRGRLTLGWAVTASPIAVAGVAVLGALFGVIEPLDIGDVATRVSTLGAVPLAATSVALIALTLGSHTRPVSLWHQPDDTPEVLVTHGAYSRIRHPFYTAFLLALGACALVIPHAASVLALAAGLIALTLTARREERRLLASRHGEAYRAYILRSGRFLPRRHAAPSGRTPNPHSPMEIPMRSLVLALITLVSAVPAAAQTLWHPDPDLPSLRLELLHPDPEGDDELGLEDIAGFLTLNVEATDDAMLVIDLPFAHAELADESSSMIGNPYIGVLLGERRDDARFEIGARLPIGEEDEFASLIGVLTDIQRIEAFTPDLAAAYAAVDWRNRLESEGFELRLRGGPTLWIFTGDNDTDSELLIDYLGQLWYVDGAARLGGGLSGRLFATSDEEDFGDRAIHQLDLLGGYDFGALEPGLLLRFPFDALLDTSAVVGIWLELEL